MSVQPGWLPLLHNPQTHPNTGLFLLEGVSLHTLGIDYLHVKYLGCDQYLYGSVLWLLVYGELGPEGAAGRMEDPLVYYREKVQTHTQPIKDGFSSICKGLQMEQTMQWPFCQFGIGLPP